MLPSRNSIMAKLIEIAEKNYDKIIRNIQEKRNRKHRLQLQAALMSGSVRRIK